MEYSQAGSHQSRQTLRRPPPPPLASTSSWRGEYPSTGLPLEQLQLDLEAYQVQPVPSLTRSPPDPAFPSASCGLPSAPSLVNSNRRRSSIAVPYPTSTAATLAPPDAIYSLPSSSNPVPSVAGIAGPGNRRLSLSAAYSAYREATSNFPPSPTTPGGHGGRNANSNANSAFSSPRSPLHQPQTHAYPSPPSWLTTQESSSFHFQWPRTERDPAREHGLRTPPPTAPLYSAVAGPPALPLPSAPPQGAVGPSTQAGWLDPSFSFGTSRPLPSNDVSALGPFTRDPPPAFVPERTRYSIAGVILDEDDFIDYATSSPDWADATAEDKPALSGLAAPDVTATPSTTTTTTTPNFYSQLLSPFELSRPASAPPEKRQFRPSLPLEGPTEQDDGVFYQITNRRRSSSVDEGMARAAAASGLPNPMVSESRRGSLVVRGSMRGWRHYQPLPGELEGSADASPSLLYTPYDNPHAPGSPTKLRRPTTPRTPSVAPSHQSPLSPRAADRLRESPTAPRGRRPAHRAGEGLSFVNFSPADAPKILKGVSRSGGSGRSKSPKKKVV